MNDVGVWLFIIFVILIALLGFGFEFLKVVAVIKYIFS
jgi:hypothetical protein